MSAKVTLLFTDVASMCEIYYHRLTCAIICDVATLLRGHSNVRRRTMSVVS